MLLVADTESTTTRVSVDITVETCGTCCPMPVIRARQGTDALEVGQTVELIADDPGARVDMPAWAKNTGTSCSTPTWTGTPCGS